MAIPTLLRLAEHKALSNLSLKGSILDLGGDDRAEYRNLIQGAHTYTTVNLDAKTKPDIFHDLEKPLPIEDTSFDNALLMNVLEHVYEHRQLLAESVRVVRPGGIVVVIVPFLFPIHPSPNDFWRFTKETLIRECERAGLAVEKIEALGSGVFAARYVMLDRLMPFPVRLIGSITIAPLVALLDRIFGYLARTLGKGYREETYALGYVVIAKKKTKQ